MEPLGIYLHIPFCTAKCPYCDFYSLGTAAMPDADAVMDAYVAALGRELALWRRRLGEKEADTVYFGGGTPLLLGPARIGRIMDEVRRNFTLREDTEVTLEANPTTARPEDFAALLKAGVNRLSMGLQSADAGELHLLGRQHSAQQAADCVRQAQQAGFTNISLDLMIGLPGQSPESIEHSIGFCADLGVPHISAYLLKVEPGTPFDRQGIQKRCPDDDTQADWYLDAVHAMAKRGYHQYEISNFSRSPKTQSRHNLKYWHCQEYLGVGPSAHGFLNGRRMFYPRNLKEFLENAGKSDYFPHPDGVGGTFEETVMLGLRLDEGIGLANLQERFPNEDCSLLAKRAVPLRKGGLMQKDESKLALTAEGFLISNSIITNLLYGV